MNKYRVRLAPVTVPEDWTNYGRKLTVSASHAPSNVINTLVNDVFNQDEHNFNIEVEDQWDIRITLDNRDGEDPFSFKGTAGASIEFSDDIISLLKYVDPKDLRVVELEPEPEESPPLDEEED